MRRAFGVVALAAIAATCALVLLGLTGALSAPASTNLPDAGRLTRLGLPVAQVLRDLSVAFTVGGLVLAATCMPPGDGQSRERLVGVRRRLIDLCALAAGLWVVSGLALIAFAFSDAAGSSLTSGGIGEAVWSFATDFELGRNLLISSGIAGVVGMACLWVRRTRSLGMVTVLAIIGLWPIALTGHSAGRRNHDVAVDALAMHLVGSSVWVGGLLALVLVARRLGPGLLPSVRRYSVLASWCLGVVGVSGLTSGYLRLDGVDGLWSTYGGILGLKAAALIVLGGLGMLQRRRFIAQLAVQRPGAFLRLASLEAAVMMVAVGIAVTLSRTAPPPPAGGERPRTTAESLLGYAMPPELNAAEWLTQWRVDTFWLPVALLALGWYLLGVRRLTRRGDSWPGFRTVSWCVGWGLFIWATSGSPGAYGRVLFSMHMVQHMTVATGAPVLLVLGAPVTLGLRTLRRREDGSMGPREWLLATVHSRVLGVLGVPVVAATLFVISLVTFYYSPLFELTLRSHTAHIVMIFHFLVTGYLLANSLVGVDPGIRRSLFPLRVLMLMVVFGFHSLFTVSLMANDQVLARDWFSLLARPWGQSLPDDQYLGASIGWALGDYPLALMAAGLILLWFRSDRREAMRFDRREDRDGDTELTSYNAHLTRLSAVQAASPVPSDQETASVGQPDEASGTP